MYKISACIRDSSKSEDLFFINIIIYKLCYHWHRVYIVLIKYSIKSYASKNVCIVLDHQATLLYTQAHMLHISYALQPHNITNDVIVYAYNIVMTNYNN